MMRVAEWRNSSSYANLNLRLLQRSRPLHSSLDKRLVIGGEPETSGGGRRGLRGGATALSPDSKHKQQRITPPRQPAPASTAPPPRPPRKPLTPLRLSRHQRSRHHRHRRRRLHRHWQHHHQDRHHRLYRHSQLPHQENVCTSNALPRRSLFEHHL
jgi:hypothetical protein